MPDPVDQYIDQVLLHASLARGDERRVRAELKDHLEELIALASQQTTNPREIYAMLHRDFGNPQTIGDAIAAAKGRSRTWLKKQKRQLPIKLAIYTVITLVLVIPVRQAVAEVFYVNTNAVAPSIPRGSRVMVYKLASTFQPGDVVVFRHPDRAAYVAIVRGTDPVTGNLLLGRNNRSDEEVPRTAIVGRVFLNTR